MLRWFLLLCVLFFFTYSSCSSKEIVQGEDSIQFTSNLLNEKAVFSGVNQASPSQSSSLTYVPYSANRVVISRNWPSNLLDVSLWVGYGAYLIMVFLSPFVVLLFLCNVTSYIWCCRKCGKCGGSSLKDKKEGYDKKSRRSLLIPIDIVFAMIM